MKGYPRYFVQTEPVTLDDRDVLYSFIDRPGSYLIEVLKNGGRRHQSIQDEDVMDEWVKLGVFNFREITEEEVVLL